MAAMVLDIVFLPKPMLKFVCQCNGVQREDFEAIPWRMNSILWGMAELAPGE